jgi:glycosyltransferase involved in cell wall biosynthesis
MRICIFPNVQYMQKESQEKNRPRKQLCLDARMYMHTGIGAYIRQRVEVFVKNPDYELILLVPEKNIPSFEGIRQIVFDAPIYSITEQLRYPFMIPACDIFWSPHYNVPLLPIRARERWATVHDVYHLRFAHTMSRIKNIYARLLYRAACHRSQRVITVSEFSKKEILHFFDIGTKLEVIPHVVDTRSFEKQYSAAWKQEVLSKYKIHDPYLLFVGNIKPHKNLITLLKAFAQIAQQVDPVKLVLVGKIDGLETKDEEVFQLLRKEPSLQDRVLFTGAVEQEELPVLFQSARLFVFPSYYEGFGTPPLEALAAGIPVICSNAGPIPEVCGNRVSYFSPFDVKALSELLLLHLQRSSLV